MATKDITDLQVCQAVDAYNRQAVATKFNYDFLAEATGQPLKVCRCAIERAVKLGLVDYGVSQRTGWLTDKGREFMQAEKFTN